MKIQATKKHIMETNYWIVAVSEDIWQDIASCLNLTPYAYTCGVYGHNADVYHVGGVSVTVGKRPFGKRYDRDRLMMWRDVARLCKTGNDRRKVIDGIASDMCGDSPLTEHHTSAARGYVSRKGNGYTEAYRGNFGIGVVRHSPRWDTTSYHYKTYYTL